MTRRLVALFAAVALVALLPAIVAAHPLGNFTINHYAGLRIGADRILLDVVSDQAEIPTFQERQRIDSNGDGTVSDAEIAAERVAACPRLAGELVLSVAGARLPLTTTAAGLSFPPGSGGLPTMRTVCEYEAALATPITAATAIRFEDRSNPDRIGWREIVAVGDSTTLASELPAESVSNRLTLYPQSLLTQALDVRVGTISATPGGPTLPPFVAPDALPLIDGAVAAGGAATGAAGGAATGSSAEPAPATAGAVPGGVGGEISGLLGATDLTPLALLLSFITAIALGAGHAVTPGHGKTIMAAYLVGSRGSLRHAFGLGLATAVSHTIGVLLLALLILAAGSALPADRVYPILTAVSGILVVGIGAWLLATQVSRRLSRRRAAAQSPALATATAVAGDHVHEDGGEHLHDHDGEAHVHPQARPVAAIARDPRRFGQQHAAYAMAFEGAAVASAGSGPGIGNGSAPVPMAASDGMHRHGWRVHSHVPPAASDGQPTALTWKSLFALGLAGGLVPSTNALLILVATVAAGRAAYGVVLVVAFGIGMAAVLVGVGLAMVYGSGMIARVPRHSSLTRLAGLAPLFAALTVLLLGLYLTQQALGGARVL